MTRHVEHIAFDELNDFVDGRLDAAREMFVSEHIGRCEACMMEHASILDLVRSTRDLPRSVLPDGDIWPDLRRELNAKKEAVLRPEVAPDNATVASRQRGPVWHSRFFLAAAAVVLMALSSGVTAVVLRRAGLAPVDSTARAPGGRGGAPALYVTFSPTELEYTRTIAELQIAVNTQRGRLSPETIRTVDHSLAVIDSAISEARGALLADPNNQILVDLLSATYQRKLDLLRRTSELGSRT